MYTPNRWSKRARNLGLLFCALFLALWIDSVYWGIHWLEHGVMTDLSLGEFRQIYMPAVFPTSIPFPPETFGCKFTEKHPYGALWRPPKFDGSAGGWIVIIPLYLPFLISLVPTLLLTIYIHKARRAYACTKCGYNLTANTSGTCPECGEPIPDRQRSNILRLTPPLAASPSSLNLPNQVTQPPSRFTRHRALIFVAIFTTVTWLSVVYFKNQNDVRAVRAHIGSARTGSSGKLAKAIEVYRHDTGRWPHILDDLFSRPSTEPEYSKWDGPYLSDRQFLTDPWGCRYQYRAGKDAHHTGTYDLWSRGPDGQDATADDLTNWTR